MPSVRRWPKFCSNVGIGSSGGFGPALPNGRYEFLLVLSHLTDERLIGRIFVCGRPEHHFCEDWREIDSLRRERVNKLAAVRGVAIGGVWRSLEHQGDLSFLRQPGLFLSILASHLEHWIGRGALHALMGRLVSGLIYGQRGILFRRRERCLQIRF